MGSRLIETILWCVKLIGRMMVFNVFEANSSYKKRN
jgi:hypothetical protein